MIEQLALVRFAYVFLDEFTQAHGVGLQEERGDVDDVSVERVIDFAPVLIALIMQVGARMEGYLLILKNRVEILKGFSVGVGLV